MTDFASYIPKRINIHIHVRRSGGIWYIGNFRRIDVWGSVVGDLTRNLCVWSLCDLPAKGGNITVNQRLSFKISLSAKEDDIAVDFAVNRQVAAEDGNITIDDGALFDGEVSAEDGN